MITALIKYYFICVFCLYIYKKTFSLFECSLITINLISILFSFTSHFLYLHFKGANYVIPIFLLWLITSIKNLRPQASYVALSISFIISYSTHAILSFILSLLTTVYHPSFPQMPLFPLLAGSVQFLFIKRFISIKRFRKGLLGLNNLSCINITTAICLAFNTLILHLSLGYTKTLSNFIGLCAVILTLAFLIYWWQAQITKTYRRNLELRELESMRTEMAELKKQMEELKAENDRLARITHRDNTLISALKNSTVKYLSTDFANPAVAEEVRNQLIENINTLSAERASLMTAHKEVSAREFATGLSLLDTLLHEMDEKALEMKITFAVHMGISLNEFIPNVVLESDLVHTVDDLLKNAFKSTRSSEKRVVQLQFYKLGKNLVIEVADSGIPFEVKSLVNMGVEKLTTYEDGSGIGLMDIWNTKETYGATYHLEECVNAAPFTKKISLTFDKKNRYSIRTLRKEEILQASRRADLQVYDFRE